jgi:PAS domain S-box-containing protein
MAVKKTPALRIEKCRMEKTATTRRRNLREAIAALVLIVITFLAYRAWTQFHSSNIEAARSREILEAVNGLLAGLLDAETGQRGFVLTGEERYLEPYEKGVQAIPKGLSTLNILLSKPENADLPRLNRLVDMKLAELRQTIELRRIKGLKPALDVILSDDGKRMMDEIRGICSEIRRREYTNQTDASLGRERSPRNALLVTVMGALILLFLFLSGLEPFVTPNPSTAFRSPLLNYGAAVLATLAATILRMALTPLIGETAVPFITYFPAVLFSAWFGGFRAGALTVILSALAADYYFVPPLNSFVMPNPEDEITLLIFVSVGFGTALLAHSQSQALARADSEAAQRAKAEAAEREQRRWFQTTLGSIGDGAIATDAMGRVTFLNDAAHSLIGWSREEAAGRPLEEVFLISNTVIGAAVENPVAKVLQQGSVVGLANHTALTARDGRQIPIDDSAAPIRDSDGRVVGAVLVFRDVTERLQAEERARLMIEAAPNAMIMVTNDGQIQMVNAQTEKLFGYRREELLGQSIEILVPERYREGHRALRASFLQEPSARRMGAGRDLFGLTKAGGEVPIEIGLNPISTSQGDLVLAPIIDISERKDAEDRLVRANKDLTRANEDLNQFAFAASHDLQEPLRMISAYSQLLVKRYRGQLDGEAELCVNFITDGTRRMRELLADLLAYTKLTSNGQETEPLAAINMNEVFAKVLENCKTTIEETQATVTRDDLPGVPGQEAHFIQLFQNLISNALKYRSEQPPRIHVSVTNQDGYWRFAVTDNGIGIDPEYHAFIFGVFKRLHGKTISGTGIGLAICQRIVERYGGRIWVESQVNQGSTFFLTLPAGVS